MTPFFEVIKHEKTEKIKTHQRAFNETGSLQVSAPLQLLC